MAKKTVQTNYRVVVEPRRLGDFGIASMSDSLLYPDAEVRNRLYRERCEELAADIKRHADNVGSVSVEHDDEPVCEHCGWEWTEESDTYNGGCCSKDEAAEQARVAAA